MSTKSHKSLYTFVVLNDNGDSVLNTDSVTLAIAEAKDEANDQIENDNAMDGETFVGVYRLYKVIKGTEQKKADITVSDF